MCGICGFYGRGDLDEVKKMARVMTHRGPDAEDFFADEKAGLYLGHRRLSIIDLTDGAQPMTTTDGDLVVTFNGEIYNHLELRRQLSDLGHRFVTSHSDTEVLLHGYREWGEALPGKMNGMWAFAIYDRRNKLLFLSRDRFGKKPLFYTVQNQTFAFASELTGLSVHQALTASVSRSNLKKYFAYGYIPAPNSLYENIFKLPGGHNLTVRLDDLTLEKKKYWEYILEPFEKIPENPEEEWGERLRELIGRAVSRRLMSDVPLGVFLSGGIDSSSITAFAAQSLGGERLKTYSIGFEEASFDESAYARIVSDLFKTQHHLEVLSMERARDMLPEVVARLDEPLGDSSLLPTYLLCQETRKHVTVALGGDGGDELFAGYDPFKALTMAGIYEKIMPRPIHEAVRLAVSALPVSHRNMSLDFRLKRTLRGLSYPVRIRNAVWLGPLEPRELNELFHEPTELEEVYAEAITAWETCPQQNMVDKTLQFYTKLYLEDDILVKADRASMMNSLEVRAPYLDIELVDFVRRIPHSYKLRHGCTKYILKKALEPVLPREILYRSKKGFGVPVGKWFSQKNLPWARKANGSLLDRGFLKEKINEHETGRVDHRPFLWNAWLLEQMGL